MRRATFWLKNHSLSEWIKSLELWTKKYSYGKMKATDNRKESKTHRR